MNPKKRKAGDVFGHVATPNKSPRRMDQVLGGPGQTPRSRFSQWGTSLQSVVSTAFGIFHWTRLAIQPTVGSYLALSLSPSPTGEDPAAFPAFLTPRLGSASEFSHTTLSSDTLLKSRVTKKRRPHLQDHLHKRSIKLNLARELYQLQCAKGYSSDFSTFQNFLQYKTMVESHDSKGYFRPQSVQNLRDASSEMADDDEWLTTQTLQLALDRARDSLNGPGPPKPFIPSFEQLLVHDKVQDRVIEKRLRPPLPRQLPPNAQQEVSLILSNPRFVSKAGREQVGHGDIRRLQPGCWLNDEIINFYGQLIMERAMAWDAGKENIAVASDGVNGRRHRAPLNVHFFNTFFWPKVQLGYKQSNLKKWTKKVDIFSKDVVLIPINHKQTHWSAAVINFAFKRIESYDSLDETNSRKGDLFEQLRGYIRDEYRDKKGAEFDFSGWSNYGRPDTPQQENGFDCGVFTMQFLESVARGQDGFSFSQKDMAYLRQLMIWEIGRAKLVENR